MPEPEVIAAAVDIINTGGVIVFPTKSLYGLGVDALNTTAVETLFRIKKRPRKKPVLILIHGIEDLHRLVRNIPETAARIIETFWPGEITIVFEAGPEIPVILTADTGKIGIRMAGHPVARALTKKMRHPITGTSANISGLPGCSAVSSLQPELVCAVDLILDAGTLSGGIGSTIVDVTPATPKILREGTIPSKKILAAINSA